METTLIPEHNEGKQNDLQFSANFNNREEAVDCFKRAHKRLLNPGVWHELGGVFSGEFVLVNETGNQPSRVAEIGDMYRIDLPGPGPKAGNGYDWVRIDAIDDRSDETAEEELFSIRVMPTNNPYDKAPVTAHFFKAGASSTFVVKRTHNEVTAYYHGRNEVTNNETGNTADNVRNSLMSTAALAGLSELQWSAMIKALLKPELGN
jgi:hypothetical protein